jgi:hypothetical protein
MILDLKFAMNHQSAISDLVRLCESLCFLVSFVFGSGVTSHISALSTHLSALSSPCAKGDA